MLILIFSVFVLSWLRGVCFSSPCQRCAVCDKVPELSAAGALEEARESHWNFNYAIVCDYFTEVYLWLVEMYWRS